HGGFDARTRTKKEVGGVFYRWGWVVARHRRLVFFLSLALVVLAVPVIPMGIGKLDGGGWDDPNSESVLAMETLHQDFKQQSTSFLIIFSSDDLPATDPAVHEEISRALAPL